MCFNGAAIRRPRRRLQKQTSCPRQLQLQRGRDPKTAETLQKLKALDEAEQASTGPRSEDRGDFLGGLSQEYREFASTGPRSEDRGDAGSITNSHCGHYASTGPRSEDRGDCHNPTCLSGPSTSFNGAAIRRPRRQLVIW